MALRNLCKELTFASVRRLSSTHRPLGAYVSIRRDHRLSSSPRQFKVTLDGSTLYIEKELAEALGWNENGPTEGVPLRLSGWGPHYFAITEKGTDAGMCKTALCGSSG